MMDHLVFTCIYNELKWMDDRRNAHIARSLRRQTIGPLLVHTSLTSCSQIHCFIIIANIPITSRHLAPTGHFTAPPPTNLQLSRFCGRCHLHPTWPQIWPLHHEKNNITVVRLSSHSYRTCPPISLRSSDSFSSVSNRLPFLPLNTFCSSSS